MAVIKNITVLSDFFDGTLSEKFTLLGYPEKWKAGEKRSLPEEVVRAVTNSGGVITIADPNAKESKIVPPSQPNPIDYADSVAMYAKQHGKDERKKVVFPEGFHDGTLQPELEALGHPVYIEQSEIIELPVSLLNRIAASGGLFSDSEEEIQQAQAQQKKIQLKIGLWRSKHEQSKREEEQNKLLAQHNAKTLAEIDSLSREYVKAVGAYKEALWQKIQELKQSLK